MKKFIKMFEKFKIELLQNFDHRSYTDKIVKIFANQMNRVSPMPEKKGKKRSKFLDITG